MDVESPNSPPRSNSYDPGSSVSSNMIEEYEDLLRYAVITPNFNGSIVSPSFKASLPKGSVNNTTTHPSTDTTKLSNLDSFTSDDKDDKTESVDHPLSSDNKTGDIRSLKQTNDQQFHGPLRNTEEMTNPPPLHSFRSNDENEDAEVSRLDCLLDTWCSELKSNVLAEFIQCKFKLNEQSIKQMQAEREQHAKAISNCNQDLQRKLELVKAYESSLAKKDEIITSLTKSLQKQKQQVSLARTFSVWKFHCSDKKREAFTEKLAIRHHNQKIKCRIIRLWFGLIQGRWKQRVEKACQMHAEEVCHHVTNEYEEKLAALQFSHEEALGEISVLRHAQSVYEENMKKAFMRGVCALNMEAMTMFNDPATCHHQANNVQYSNEPEHVCTAEDTHHSSGKKHLNVKFQKTQKKNMKASVTVERH